jgi:hypothetical protein
MKITDNATIELDNKLTSTILQKQELIKKLASKFARKNGYNSVTSIVVSDKYEIIEHVRFGYRKISNDQYVPNAYLNKFGWKNTYYQNAKTSVAIDFKDLLDNSKVLV